MKKFSISIILFIVSALSLASCSKEDDATPLSADGLPDCDEGYRLQKRIFGGTGTTWTFHYDSQGRMVKRVDQEANGKERIRYYEYSIDNKPDKVRVVELQGNNEVLIEEQTITYTAARHPVSLVSFYPGDNSVITHRYTTDSQGRIIVDSLSNPFYFVGAYELKWENENLVNSVYLSVQHVDNEYDNNPNPFYDIRYCFLDNASSGHYWSKNNVKAFTFKQGIVQHTDNLGVEYYSNGLISRNFSGENKYECK